MIVLNTPHNPTGTVWQAGDQERLARLVRGTDILILSDEVYEHVVFDGALHQSVIRYPELVERSVAVFSFGKTFHVTGWRVGYCVAPRPLMEEIRKVHQFAMFAADTPMQYGFAHLLQQPAHYQGLAAFYQRKRDLLASALAGSRPDPAPLGRQLLHAGELRAGKRRAGQPVRAAAHPRSRGRHHSGLRLLSRRHGSAGHPPLLLQG